ncbi:TPA: helix-turn-helix transcriptional regulator [Staphylococcus aureus]|uniref:ArsR/SmtB family transcription factor n=1 Tax=Mammaliicoccus sciuri TaxID=1296 RepID=UPI002DB7132B|nr:metalloregulator ArsR/SmtB family transcription factor [Mammaliicoccus sciuri]HDH4650249.1 helix-turn-helix transcriptional regulator [Staphylococcus aureus]HDH4883572.1 helix-turn-helix transcriptional regulator [Staphylococcus argenteus]MEB6340186.1 helix-turn-helix domain-containing protein [Mammaliicoccus sciuri]HDH4650851.1 helix-turn-helix transcriptional regulator [Staphylococcus aureus]HDH4883852.1 helix-turn-helix transcriptional regulator [Staphylococcus argenteus]
MENLKVLKALAHPTRLHILSLLKTPAQSFIAENNLDKDSVGICVQEMQLVLGISQSTTSQHLSILHDASLLSSKKIGKYTYFKRNEVTLRKLADNISNEI